MDTTYFDTYSLNWMYDYLNSKGLIGSMIGDGYYMFKNDTVICFINIGEPMHPNTDFRLAIDNAKAFNKIGQVPVSIDVFNTTESEVSKWLDFMGSKEGHDYSNTFAYLDDEDRPCVVYP